MGATGLWTASVMCLALAAPAGARAAASGVGLGVAGGIAYSGTKIDVNTTREAVGARVAWGFFVDIPLLATFYITPAAMLYELDVDGDGERDAVTDVDLNFKFIVPLGDLRFGAGLTAGLSSGVEDSYAPHYGLLGFASMNLVANLDVFLLGQYKKLVRDAAVDINDVHLFAGGMFHF